jgi:hypothetical protein
MVKVLEPITTKLDPISEKVMPPAVTACVCAGAGGARMVPPPIPTPPGPILTVTPSMTSVVGVACAPRVKVLPPIIATKEPISVNVIPAAVMTCVWPGDPF